MRVLLLLLLAGLTLCLLTCSDDDSPTDSNNDNPNDSMALSISYVSDNGRAVTEAVTAAAGDTITATNAAGVTFTLVIPAGALPNDTTITITPLASLAVTGLGSFACSGCGGDDPLCCFHGALFEPAGLGFDSAATLTITFPDGAFPFAVDDHAGIAWIDSSCAFLGARPGTVTVAERTITGEIDHFSGYMSWEYDCPIYRANYEAAVADLSRHIGSEVLYYRARDIYEAGHSGDADFCAVQRRDDVVNGYLLQQATEVTATCEALYGDVAYIQEAVGFLAPHLRGFQSVASIYSNGDYGAGQVAQLIDSKLRAAAEAAHQACVGGDYAARATLEAIFAMGQAGYIISAYGVPDLAYVQQVGAWAEDCVPELAVSVAASNTQVNRCAIYESDLYDGSCVCTLTVSVTSPGGEPREGAPIRLTGAWGDEYDDDFGRGTTDADGKVYLPLTYKKVADMDCALSYSVTVSAMAYDSEVEEWFEAGNSVSVTFRNLMLQFDLTYTCEINTTGNNGGYGNALWTIEGGGYGPAREATLCAPSCTGKLARDLTSESCVWSPVDSQLHCSSTATTDMDTVWACRARPDFRSENVGGVTVDRLVGIATSVSEPLFWGMVYTTTSEGGSVVDTVDWNNTSGTVWPEGAFVFDVEYGGPSHDTTWTESQTEPFTKEATLELLVSAFF